MQNFIKLKSSSLTTDDCYFITISNCRTACLGWDGRTQFDFILF